MNNLQGLHHDALKYNPKIFVLEQRNSDDSVPSTQFSKGACNTFSSGVNVSISIPLGYYLSSAIHFRQVITHKQHPLDIAQSKNLPRMSTCAVEVHSHFAVEMEADTDGRCVSWNDADPRQTRLYFAENDNFQTYVMSKLSDSEVTSPNKETAIPRKTILDSAFHKGNNTACFLVTKPEDVDSDDSNSDRDNETPVPFMLYQYDKKNKIVSKKELFRIKYAESLIAIHDNGDILIFSEQVGERPYVQVFDGKTFDLKTKFPCHVRGAYRMYAVPGVASTSVLLASTKGLYCQDLVTNTHLHVRHQKHIDDFTVLPDGRVVLGMEGTRIQLLSKDLGTVEREWSSHLTVDTSLNPGAIDMELDSDLSDDDSDAEDLFVDDEEEDGEDNADDEDTKGNDDAKDEEGKEDAKHEDNDETDMEDTRDNDAKEVVSVSSGDTSSVAATSSNSSGDSEEDELDVFKQIQDIVSSEQYVYVRFMSDDVVVYKISSL